MSFRGVREAGLAAVGHPEIAEESVVAHAGGMVARVGFSAAAWGSLVLGIGALLALGTACRGWRERMVRVSILAGLGLGVVQYGYNSSIQQASDRRWELSLRGDQAAADAVGEAVHAIHQTAEGLYAVQTVAVAIALASAVAWGRGRRKEQPPLAAATSESTCQS